LSQSDAKDVMQQSMQTLSLMILNMQGDLAGSRDVIIDIAKKTEEAAAKGEAVQVKAHTP